MKKKKKVVEQLDIIKLNKELIRCLNPNDIYLSKAMSCPKGEAKVRDLMYQIEEYLVKNKHIKQSDLLKK